MQPFIPLPQKGFRKTKPKNMKFKKFFIVRFKFIVLFVVLAMGIGGYFYIIRPLILSYKVRYGEVVEIKSMAKTAEIKFQTKRDNSEEVRDVIEGYDLKRVEKIFPKLNEKEDMLLILKQLGIDAGLNIVSISFGEGVKFSEYYKTDAELKKQVSLPIVAVPVSLSVKGDSMTYDNIKNIIRILYSKYALFNLKILDIQNQDKNKTTASSDFELSFDVFFVE